MASPVDQHVSYNRISKEIVCVLESKHRMYNLGAMGCRIDPSCLTTGVNKDRGMCYPDYGMVHIKEPLLLFVVGMLEPSVDMDM